LQSKIERAKQRDEYGTTQQNKRTEQAGNKIITEHHEYGMVFLESS